MFRELLRRRGGLFASDSKTISIPLAVAGVMKWAAGYPKPSYGKTSYAVGETVNLDLSWTNTGGAAANAVVKITDVDTGATVFSSTMSFQTAAGATYGPASLSIGAMPNKTWNLRCDITP